MKLKRSLSFFYNNLNSFSIYELILINVDILARSVPTKEEQLQARVPVASECAVHVSACVIYAEFVTRVAGNLEALVFRIKVFRLRVTSSDTKKVHYNLNI
jgi:hypothetical protein